MQIIKNRLLSFPTIFNYSLFGLFLLAPFVGYLTRAIMDTYFTYLMVMACFVSIYLIFLDKLKFRIPASVILLFLFLLYTTLSDLLIVNAKFDLKYLYNNLILGSLLIMIIIENTRISDRFFKIMFYVNHVIMFIAFIVIILQQFYDPTFFVNPEFHEILENRAFSNTRFPSIYSYIGSTNAVGLCFVPVLGVMIAHHLKNKIKGVAYLYFIGIVVAFLSKSRFIMLNYLLLYALLPIYRGFNLGSSIKYISFFVIFLVSVYAGSKMIGFDADTIINERILEKNKGGMLEGTAGTRVLAFEVFQKLYYKNPIFGKGKFHSFGPEGSKDFELVNLLRGRSSQIHVGYLSLFYYYGFVGGLIFLAFLFMLTREYYLKSIRLHTWGPFFSVIQFLLINATGVMLHVFFMGMIISFLFQKYYDQENHFDR